MTPEQQHEYRRREDRKSFITAAALNTAVTVKAQNPDRPTDVIVREAFELGEALALEREARDLGPG